MYHINNGGNYTGGFSTGPVMQQRTPQQILDSIVSIQNSEDSKKQEHFIIELFQHFITESINDSHRYDRNVYKLMSYLPNTQDELSIVVCIEINDTIKTIKHSILRLEDAIKYNIKFELLDDSLINRLPMITTTRTKLKADFTIDDFMFRLNQFVDEIWEFGVAMLAACGNNINAVNSELSKYSFEFGGIVVTPLYTNVGDILFQYSFNRLFCQTLKGDAMFAYVERNKDI